ncbi:MAG: hypothetical protein ABA06_02420 [Parcubacteria bacterium C7867-001]|nr:MAG: hypothetical protein ABA06_02420 [Parcubacteria bacterium C7867-001]
MEGEQGGSPLERLNKRLYAPAPTEAFNERTVSRRDTSVPTGWQQEPAPVPVAPKKKIAASTIFLIGAAVFFLIACGVAAWLVFAGGRSVSTDHIDIKVQGPTTSAGGDTIPLLISIKNNNPVDMNDTNLVIDFPEGTYSGDEQNTPLSHYADTLGTIPAGATAVRTIRATLFGNENQRVVIPIMLEYKTDGSKAIFQKKTEYSLTIGTSPVGLSVNTLSEVSSAQPFTIAITVRSNSATPLQNVELIGTYPFGFSVTKADPQPETGSVFVLGTLAPGEERKITITGALSAADNEQRVFHFDVGTPGITSQMLGVTYTSAEVPLTVSKPFLAARLSINQNETDPLIVQGGTPIQGLLSWENTLSTPIKNAQIIVKFSGSALDPAQITSGTGFYRSSDTSILFSSDKDQGLRSLQPGDTGNGSFSLMTKTGSALASLRNPVINLSVSVSGQRVGETGVPTSVNSTITRTLKVATDFLLSSRVVKTVGPFVNTGPWPPVADKESTYTIILSATNSVNSVAEGTATMTLPSYVRFTGKTNGSVTYNENSRVVTWDLGDVAAGTSREAAFQVALTPSLSQRGISPVLVGKQTLSGFDRFIGKQVQSDADPLDTRTETDPAYQFSKGEVQQ